MLNLPKSTYPVVIPMIKAALDGNEDDLGLIAGELERRGYLKSC